MRGLQDGELLESDFVWPRCLEQRLCRGRTQQVLFSHSVGSDSFAAPWTVANQAPLSLGFSRWEYWSGLPFPSPGDLPDPGMEPASPEVVGGLVATASPMKPSRYLLSSEWMNSEHASGRNSDVCALSSCGEEGVCRLLEPFWGKNNTELWGTSLGLGARSLAMVLAAHGLCQLLRKEK